MKDLAGKVKWFNDSKGYGFITVNDRDVFAHYTQIMGDGFKTLTEDQEVTLDITEVSKRPTATNIRRKVG